MKIIGLISSPTDPASRFRIQQYEKPLLEIGDELNCIYPTPLKESDPSRLILRNKYLWHLLQVTGRLPLLLKQYSYDLIWQNRLLLNDHYIIERYFSKPKIFDLDDAIWLTEGKKQVDKALTNSTMVFAGNEYLADYCSLFNKNVKIVPSVINIDQFKPDETEPAFFTLGWIGTKSNFKYLSIIIQPIIDFLNKTRNTKFIVISTEMPENIKFDNERIIFKYWHSNNENADINQMSVGLMPLSDDEWTKGKCSYKMLQYMACGKPVIVSPVGHNNKLLSLSNIGIGAINSENWLKAFLELYNDKDRCNEYSQNGRLLVEKKYSTNIWSKIISNYFKESI